MSTKVCESCDAVIGKDEKVCPACKIDLEKLEESLTELERIQKVQDKRRKAATPTPTVTVRVKATLFGGLFKK